MNQIPTKYRLKIPKDHGFPISNSVLSESLRNTPQFGSLTVCYEFADVLFVSDYQRKLKNEGEIAVVSLEYRHPEVNYSSSNNLIEDGFYEPNWSIKVASLPKVYLKDARESIKSKGLVQIEHWLKKIGLLEDHINRKATVYFNLKKRVLRFHATHS